MARENDLEPGQPSLVDRPERPRIFQRAPGRRFPGVNRSVDDTYTDHDAGDPHRDGSSALARLVRRGRTEAPRRMR